MQTLHAIYENGVFRPTEAVDLPDDCEVDIRIQARRTVMERPTLARLAALGRRFPVNPELPEDLATHHDHYLYGVTNRL